MSRLQLNFNGGEIDPDERERVDLKLYDTGLAKGLNVISRPHGGLSGRPGLVYFARLKGELEDLVVDAGDVTMTSGGVAADLVAGSAVETTANSVTDETYVIAEIDFGADVSLSAIDIADYYFDDGTESAGELPPVNGSGGGGTLPEDVLPGRPDYKYPGDYLEP